MTPEERRDTVELLEWNRHSDSILRRLVDLLNEVDSISFGVTLSVGGMLVSGQLVGAKTYHNAMAQGFGAEFEKAVKTPAMRELFESFANGIQRGERKESEVNAEAEGLMWRMPMHIHLKDARFFHPGAEPLPSNSGVWWRGRLSAIDGFSFGDLKSSRD